MKTTSPVREKKSKMLFGAPWDDDVRRFVQVSGTINRPFIRALNYIVLTLKTLNCWSVWERLYVLPPDNTTAMTYCLKTRLQGTVEINAGGSFSLDNQFGMHALNQVAFHTGFQPQLANIINPSDWMYAVWNTSNDVDVPSGTGAYYIASLDTSTSEMEFQRTYNNAGTYTQILGQRGTGSVQVTNVAITGAGGIPKNDFWTFGCSGGTGRMRVIGNAAKLATATIPVTSFASPNEVLFLTANNAGTPNFSASLNQENVGLFGICSYIPTATQTTLFGRLRDLFYAGGGRRAYAQTPPPSL